MQGWKKESKSDSHFFGSYQNVANLSLNLFAMFWFLPKNCKLLFKLISSDLQLVCTVAPYCIKLL